MRRLLLIGALTGLAACNSLGTSPSSSQPSLPPPTTPQTVYTGSITDSVNGAGSVTISVSSVESIAGGTWSATYPGLRTVTRFISGTLKGTAYTATVSDCIETDSQACFPNCRQTFTGTLTSAGLTGTYAEVPGDSCTAHSGSVNASRQ